jgi:hypothetical protein
VARKPTSKKKFALLLPQTSYIIQNFIMKFPVSLFFLFCFFSVQTVISQPADSVVHRKKNLLADNSHGFYNVTTFSFDFFEPPVINGMQTICGYRLNPFISIGGGIGIERYVGMNVYDTLTANLTLLPVFGEIRYTILNKKVSPVIALQGGYKFLINRSSTEVTTWKEDIFPPYAYRIYDEYNYYYEGGFSFTIEAGVRAKLYQRLAIYFSADFSVWTVAGDYYKWTYEYLSAPGGSIKETYTHYTLPTMAYNQMLLFRVGVAF